MRVQPRILICQIGVRNMVILVSEINRSTAVGCEQLHTTPKLSRKVELLSGSKHSMVEVEEAATARQKGFDAAEMHEIYLCADWAATDAIGVRSPTMAGPWIADDC